MPGAEHTALGYDSLEVSSDIAAFPDSVNSLEGVCGDVRTPDKLIDQVNNTSDGRHMWLAPILPGLVGSGGSQPWGGWGAGGAGGVCGTFCPQFQRHIFLPDQVNLETSQNAQGLPGRLRSLLTHLPSQRSFPLLWGC